MTLVPGQVFVLTMEGDLEYVWRNVFNKWIVIQFGAEWSGVCSSMNQAFVDLARSHVEVLFVHCDVDRLAKIAAKHGATRVPTYSFFWNGELETEFAGASERKLRDVLNDCIDLGPCPDPGERVFDDRPMSSRVRTKPKATPVAKKKKSPVKKTKDTENLDRILAQSAAEAEKMKKDLEEKQATAAKQAEIAEKRARHKEARDRKEAENAILEVQDRRRREEEDAFQRELEERNLKRLAEERALEDSLADQRAAEAKAREEEERRHKEQNRRLLGAFGEDEEEQKEKPQPEFRRGSLRSPRGDVRGERGRLGGLRGGGLTVEEAPRETRKREEPKSAPPPKKPPSPAFKDEDSGSDSGVDLNIKSLKTEGDLVVERNQRADQRALPPPAWEKFAMDPTLFDEGEDSRKATKDGQGGQRVSILGVDRATKKSREKEKKDKEEEELRRAERQLKAISKHRTSDPHLEGSLRDLESHLSVLSGTQSGRRQPRGWKQTGSSSDVKDDLDT